MSWDEEKPLEWTAEQLERFLLAIQKAAIRRRVIRVYNAPKSSEDGVLRNRRRIPDKQLIGRGFKVPNEFVQALNVRKGAVLGKSCHLIVGEGRKHDHAEN